LVRLVYRTFCDHKFVFNNIGDQPVRDGMDDWIGVRGSSRFVFEMKDSKITEIHQNENRLTRKDPDGPQ
jgi:hypothetical protein